MEVCLQEELDIGWEYQLSEGETGFLGQAGGMLLIMGDADSSEGADGLPSNTSTKARPDVLWVGCLVPHPTGCRA